MITFASPSDSTKMCRAVAFTASGGGPYSAFVKAFDIESKIPMLRDDDSIVLVSIPECTEIKLEGRRNPDAVDSIKTRHGAINKVAREVYFWKGIIFGKLCNGCLTGLCKLREDSE